VESNNMSATKRKKVSYGFHQTHGQGLINAETGQVEMPKNHMSDNPAQYKRVPLLE
jgi:hypothetical protein